MSNVSLFIPLGKLPLLSIFCRMCWFVFTNKNPIYCYYFHEKIDKSQNLTFLKKIHSGPPWTSFISKKLFYGLQLECRQIHREDKSHEHKNVMLLKEYCTHMKFCILELLIQKAKSTGNKIKKFQLKPRNILALIILLIFTV